MAISPHDSLGFSIQRFDSGFLVGGTWIPDFKWTMDRKRICRRTKNLKRTWLAKKYLVDTLQSAQLIVHVKINFERHKHNTDMTQSEQAFSQHSFLVLSVAAPFWRVTIMTKQLSTATTPLCFGFYWSCVSGFQSLMGFRIPWAEFRIPQAKICRIPESELPYIRQAVLFIYLQNTNSSHWSPYISLIISWQNLFKIKTFSLGCSFE